MAPKAEGAEFKSSSGTTFFFFTSCTHTLHVCNLALEFSILLFGNAKMQYIVLQLR